VAESITESPQFDQSLVELGLHVSNAQISQLLQFLQLLQRWNKVINLTSVDRMDEMLTKHFLDSLSVAGYIHGQRIADVGSGGGLPGIPLAIACPGSRFTLIDSVAKKTRFLRQVVTELGLSNVEVVHARAEKFHPDMKFDQIISRAFSGLTEFIGLTEHLLAEQGEWLAMKGKYPDDELAALDTKMAYTVHPLSIPGLDADRHLIQITHTA